MSEDAIELTLLDPDVRRAAARVDKRRALLAGAGADAVDRARSFDPWEGVRHTATQATYKKLAAMEPPRLSLLDIPLRDGLVRWTHELLQERIGQDLLVADAEACRALDDRLPAHRVAALKAAEKERLEAGGEGDAPRDVDAAAHTYGDALTALVHAPDDVRASAALERAGELAPGVAAVRKERRERRFEAARRLGLAHPWSLVTTSDVRAAARSFLDDTEALSVEVLKIARKSHEGPWRASSAIQLAHAREANDGWPSHLGPRWLDDAFKPLAPRGVDPGRLPDALGGASFVRSVMQWGHTFKAAGTPRSMPFAIARGPYGVPAHRFGLAFAWVVTEPLFQRRVLDLPARVAAAQTRILRRTAFLHARTIAARALLGAEENVTASLFEEIGARVFGAPLPAAMRDAWPDPRLSDPARLVALLGARAFTRDLVERYDDDWFRNPRAGSHLTSLACGPAHDDDPIAEGAPLALARVFEQALG